MFKSITKSALLLLLILSVMFSSASCGEDDDYGKINDVKEPVKTQSVSIDGEEYESELNPTKTELDYEWTYVNNGRAMISIPYPSTWTMKKSTDYTLRFIAPADDPYFPGQTIYFHSTLEGEEITDIHKVRDRFIQQLQTDRFTYNGSVVTLYPSSPPEKVVVNTKIAEPEMNYHIAYKDWNANVKSKGKAYENLYHQDNVFYWRNVPCILIGMTDEENADNLSDILDYMMSNSKVINDTIGGTYTASLFSSTTDMKIPMCPVFEHYELEPVDTFTNGEAFSCPADSGTGFSQSTICIYEVKTENYHLTSKNFEDVYRADILKSIFGSAYKKMQPTGYMKYDDGYLMFGDEKAHEYIYPFVVNASTGLDEGLYYGQQWELYMYELSHDKTTELFVLCAPSDGMIWGFEMIKKIAEDITFGK